MFEGSDLETKLLFSLVVSIMSIWKKRKKCFNFQLADIMMIASQVHFWNNCFLDDKKIEISIKMILARYTHFDV